MGGAADPAARRGLALLATRHSSTQRTSSSSLKKEASTGRSTPSLVAAAVKPASRPARMPPSPLSDNKPRADGILAVDDPSRGTDDIGPALDRRAHRRLFAEHGFADEAAFKHAGAKQALRLDRLIESKLAARMQHRHHRRRAGATGRAVELARAEDVHVLVEGAGQTPLVPERDEVEVADVALCWMLQFELLAQHFARGDADLRQLSCVGGVDFKALAADVDDAEIVATPSHVGAHPAEAWYIERDVLRRHVGRHVLETAPGHAVALVGDFADDRAGGGLKANGGTPILAFGYHAQRHHGHRDGNRSVATHVRILSTVDPDQAGVEARL